MAAAASPFSTLPDPMAMTADIGRWLAVHWLQIAIAVGAGILIYLALHFLRGLVKRFCRREHEPGLLTVAGRAAQRTSHLFMIIVAARLVAGYASPPDLVMATVRFLFTVAAVIQVAIWIREIVMGLIELRSGQEGSESIANALGIISILMDWSTLRARHASAASDHPDYRIPSPRELPALIDSIELSLRYREPAFFLSSTPTD